jgi:precorrin-3B C17-methyltransferase
MTERAPAAGEILIVGLGPGPDHWRTPEATAALERASDLVGYGPYVDRCPERAGQVRHASDNRVELDRASEAIELARSGRIVAVVSGGDPGIFAMAAAVFEAIEADVTARDLTITVMPGVSAMQAAAARLGAPLGHDFCAINLSDNLKPWALVERRLKAAAEGDFVIAVYNPASKARPDRIFDAFTLLKSLKSGETPVAFARAVGRPDERILITTLAEADPAVADMATLVLIGSSETRLIDRPAGRPWLLTPRQGRGGAR